MFDFHMHSGVSFDGRDTAANMAQAALQAGLKEICFTDHMDYHPVNVDRKLNFSIDDYARAYDNLQVPGLTIRRGFEFGMLPGNREQFQHDLQLVIGTLSSALSIL